MPAARLTHIIAAVGLGVATIVASGCGKAPFPKNPIPDDESAQYESAVLGLYEGLPAGKLDGLMDRRPLLRATGPDNYENIYVFRTTPPSEEAEPSSGSTYLRVYVDRSTKRVTGWDTPSSPTP